MNILEILHRIKTYSIYKIFAKTKYSIHSPFVYDFVTNVLNNNEDPTIFKEVEVLRKELINNHSTIEVNDLGNNIRPKYFTKISAIAKKSSKNKKFASLLYRMVAKYTPNAILELGTCFGISTIYMALGASNAKIFTIEGCKNRADLALNNFTKLKLENIFIQNTSFEDAIQQFKLQNISFSFIFIDGHHQKKPTIKYFFSLLPLISSESIVVIDDIHWSKEMSDCWQQIITHESITVSIDVYQMGILFFNKELSKEHFIIKF